MALNTKKNNQTSTRRKTAAKSAPRKSTANRQPARTKAKNATDFPLFDEVILWGVLALSIIILISNFGIGGFIGNAISSFFFGVFGFLSYIFPFVLFLIIAFVVSNKGNKIAWIKSTAVFLLWAGLCAITEMLVNGYDPARKIGDFYKLSSAYKTGGGFIGGIISKPLSAALGVAGSYVLLAVLVIICVVLITERSLFAGMRKGGRRFYQSAKKDVGLRRQKAELRREKKELERQRYYEEEAERLQEEKAQLGNETGDPRLEKRFSGVSLDTLLKPTDAPAEDIHEVIPPVPGKARKQSGRAAAVNPAAAAVSPPDFTITGADISDLYTEQEEPEEELIDTGDAFRSIMSSVGGSGQPAAAAVETPPAPVPEDKIVKNPKSSQSEQEANLIAVAQEIEQTAKELPPEYVFPPIKLLNRPKRGKSGNSDMELRETALKLQETLHNFGVEVNVTNVSCGPSVTRYELTPEQGVKVSRIVNLADDIKLNLAAADIRIEAPIPGKAAVGIEVPNKKNSAVMLRELLETPEFKDHPSNLAFAAGKDIGGKVVVADIARMPHLLIAGATGSGKSVCINTLIMSILYKAKPEDVKLIMIDPKVVELSVYNGIPHLFIPVVTDPKKAAGALNWGVAEMDQRYKKFADLNVRDLKGYNDKIAAIKDIDEENKPEKLPQIVIIVDELADLMMVAPGEVEDSICRLAQLARAAGIHLIIATQRPSVNVITGLIKANMPSRIAFSVSSGVDSRTIIDMNGAEKLLGKGDMLFYPQGYQKPARVQGAFVSDDEVSDVVEFLTKENAAAGYNTQVEDQIIKAQQVTESGGTAGSEVDNHFAEAGKFIIEKDKASIGMLQRVFKIGFNRAARIMDQLSDAGVVGPEEGTKPRKVLMTMEEFENYLEESV